MQGQTFLQSGDYNTATTVRIAAHEMLHPPFPMDGPAARAALAVLERDALIMRIVREHNPQWGYTTLDGLLDEDICEALDQLISEALGVGRNPADRWRRADDGMHVIAAGLYGLLREDRWVENGGSIERWIADAAARGRLAPAVLHPVAARVLERPVDRLWPLRRRLTGGRARTRFRDRPPRRAVFQFAARATRWEAVSSVSRSNEHTSPDQPASRHARVQRPPLQRTYHRRRRCA